MSLPYPYLIFLGATQNPAIAKTALGLAQWAPEKCLAQHRFQDCTIDLDLPALSISEARQQGARSLVLGCAPVGGGVEPEWLPVLLEAIDAGMDIISGFHTRLSDIPALRSAASAANVRLIDIRIPPENIAIATGAPRSGKRLLTVGTDCSVGKKYAALTLSQAMQARGIDCDFRASGQTGIMIAGGGIPMDAVVSDFVAGAAEQLSPANQPDHWDVIEGQGSLYHPAYAGVSLGLLHGSQPDALVLCHDATRQGINAFPGYPLPTIKECITRNLSLAALTNPAVKCIGLCVNTSGLPAGQRLDYLKQLSDDTQLPCVDPLKDGVQDLIDGLLGDKGSPT